jgi:hypothetical protein
MLDAHSERTTGAGDARPQQQGMPDRPAPQQARTGEREGMPRSQQPHVADVDKDGIEHRDTDGEGDGIDGPEALPVFGDQLRDDEVLPQNA